MLYHLNLPPGDGGPILSGWVVEGRAAVETLTAAAKLAGQRATREEAPRRSMPLVVVSWPLNPTNL